MPWRYGDSGSTRKLESDTYPLLVVRPEAVFAFSMDDFVGAATRWRFGPEP